MRASTTLGTLTLLACALTAGPAGADPEAATRPAGSRAGATGQETAQAEMMKKWQEFATPGPEHERLLRSVGKWNTQTQMYTAPGAPPTRSAGSCEMQFVLGGRFLMSKCQGQMMGMAFEGTGFEGYDNFRKKYVSVWMDNMSTAVHVLTGTCDEKSNCTYHGEMDEFLTGAVAKPVQTKVRWMSDDQFVFEMYDSAPGGEWFKVFDIAYTRAK